MDMNHECVGRFYSGVSMFTILLVYWSQAGLYLLVVCTLSLCPLSVYWSILGLCVPVIATLHFCRMLTILSVYWSVLGLSVSVMTTWHFCRMKTDCQRLKARLIGAFPFVLGIPLHCAWLLSALR